MAGAVKYKLESRARDGARDQGQCQGRGLGNTNTLNDPLNSNKINILILTKILLSDIIQFLFYNNSLFCLSIRSSDFVYFFSKTFCFSFSVFCQKIAGIRKFFCETGVTALYLKVLYREHQALETRCLTAYYQKQSSGGVLKGVL